MSTRRKGGDGEGAGGEVERADEAVVDDGSKMR